MRVKVRDGWSRTPRSATFRPASFVSLLLSNNINVLIQNCNYSSRSIWVWNLVSHILHSLGVLEKSVLKKSFGL